MAYIDRGTGTSTMRAGTWSVEASAGVRRGDVMFAATGVTKGYLLDGVRFFGDSAKTESIVMRSKSGTVRVINATHHFNTKPKYSWATGLEP